jgi:hypothetical protein
MKKSFSVRTADIEVIVTVEKVITAPKPYKGELVNGVRFNYSGRVVKHGMGRSRTILNNRDFKIVDEALGNLAEQRVGWMLAERKIRTEPQTQGEQQ